MLFAIDASTDVKMETIEKVKKFVKQLLAETMTVSDKTRVGILQYDGTAVMKLKPSDGVTLQKVTTALDGVAKMMNTRNLARTIKYVQQYAFDYGDTSSGKYVVLLVNGKDSARNNEELRKALAELEEKDVHVTVVGIGEDVDELTLVKIASNPNSFIKTSLIDLFTATPVIVDGYGKAVAKSKNFFVRQQSLLLRYCGFQAFYHPPPRVSGFFFGPNLFTSSVLDQSGIAAVSQNETNIQYRP